ncbi:hypothetical protein RB595_007831 [Gaeumannomyces hyphopodioides]
MGRLSPSRKGSRGPWKIHDGAVRLVGNMGMLEAKLASTDEVHEFNVCLDSEYIMLKFPDDTNFAQVSELLTRGLGAVHKLCPEGGLDVRAFVKSADVHNVLQRAKRPAEAVLKVDINLYGPRSYAEKVGSVLSDAEIYLQYPDDGLGLHGLECHNPHVIEFPGLEYVPRDSTNGSDPANGTWEANTSEGQENERRAILGAYESLTRHKNLERTKAGSGIRTQLLPHQEQALHFMLTRENGPTPEGCSLWERSIGPESGGGEVRYKHKLTGTEMADPPSDLGGGILADDMGMGKSLSSLALIMRSLKDAEAWAREDDYQRQQSNRAKRTCRPRRCKATLILVPSALIMETSWKPEIDNRLNKPLKVNEYYGKFRDNEQELYESSDIVFSTYHTVAASLKRPGSVLRQISWFRIILDEAHTIRRKETTLFKAALELSANFRWCLTATPIQNRLDDLASLISFLKLSQLENPAKFRKYVAGPIKEDADKGARALAHLMDCICLRRERENAHMPAPEKEVRWVRLSPAEDGYYRRTHEAMANLVRAKAWERTGKGNHFGPFQVQLQLRLLCNHGTYQKPFSVKAQDRRTRRDARLDLISGGADVDCSACGAPIPLLDAFGAGGSAPGSGGSRCQHRFCQQCLSSDGSPPGHSTATSPPSCSVCREEGSAWGNPNLGGNMMVPQETVPQGLDGQGDYFNTHGTSSKIDALMVDLERVGLEEKSIVFSCWTRSLDLIAARLKERRIQYQRIDGDHSLRQRQDNMERFTKDRDMRVLIMSTGVGAFGLNLTAASRIFILEPQWNPSVERQAIGRAVRIGQSRQVHVVRYLVEGSVETVMHQQQQRKVQLARAGFEKDKEQDQGHNADISTGQ